MAESLRTVVAMNYSSDLGPERHSSAGLPRWLQVAAIIVVIVALLVVAMLLFSPGGHRPPGV